MSETVGEIKGFFEVALDLLCIADLDGTFRKLNPQWGKTLGYPARAMIGKNMLAFTHPEDVNETRSFLKRLRGQRPAVQFVNRLRCADGTYRDIEWRSFASSGVVYASARDITERLRIERELVEERRVLEARVRERTRDLMASQAQFAHLLQTMKQGVVYVDAAGRITSLNGAAQALLGAPAECVVGKTLAESMTSMFREDGAPFPPEAMPDAVALRTGLIVRGKVAGITQPDTTALKWVMIDAVPMEDNGGGSGGGVFVTLTDITERKELDRSLFQAQKMESVGRLTSGVAHDFNNCLFCMLGWCDMALEKIPAGAPVRELIEQIRQAANQAAGVTRQLLAFTRKQAPRPKPTDLNQLIRDQRTMLARLLGEDIRVNIVCEEASAVADVDATQFVQVLLNLCINARDAIPRGGTLSLETSSCARGVCVPPGQAAQTERYIRVRVADTGVGMSADAKKHLFDPYFTTKEQGKGTGLGLSVVYGIVTQHGGWIAVDSQEGKGTRFDVYFPASSGSVGPAVTETLPPVGFTGAGRVALLVEDAELVRAVEAVLLRDLGYRVIEAGSVEEARRAFHAEGSRAGLLLSDVVLPDGNGIDLAEELLRVCGGMTIVMCSGYGDENGRYRKIRERGWSFIEKPFSKQGLAALLGRLAKPAPVSFPLL